MQTAQLPFCIQVVQALGPTAVAVSVGILAAYIAYHQWQTANTKLKLDLFKERFEIFGVLEEINRAWPSSSGEEEWNAKYFGRMGEATHRLQKFRLLFPVTIGERVDEIVDMWHDFVTEKAEGESLVKPSEKWTIHVKNLRRLWEEIGKKNKNLRKEIEDFIRIDWKG